VESQLPPTPDPVAPMSHSSYQAWKLALTRPSEATYRDLVDDPRASLGRAAAWVFVASLVSSLLALLAQLVPGGLAQTLDFVRRFAPEADLGSVSTLRVGWVVCMAPVTAAMGTIGLLIYAGLLQFIAGAFSGQGTFAKMAYALAAYTAPLSVVRGLLGMLPLVSFCLALPLAAYGTVLNLLAVKAVNRFTWRWAVATVLTLLLIVVVVAWVLVLLTLRMLPQDRPLDSPLDRYRL
jgi:hypothetical protein